MLKFKYVAVNSDGEQVKGTIEATSETAARVALLQQELTPASITEHRSLLQMELTKKKIPREEIMHFSRQLGSFVRAGIPIIDAISTIADDASNPTLKKVLADINDALHAGAPFAEAVEAHRKMFPPFYVGILRSAEMTGQLDVVLDQLSKYIERDLEAKRKIRSALAYPLVILGMSIVTVVVLAVFVMPRFEKFFESLDATLPLPTRMLLAVSGTFTRFWYLFVLAFILFTVGLVMYVRSPGGRRTRDRMFLRMPLIGGVVRTAVIERFTRTLSSMTGAGVPLPDGLRIAAEGTNNTEYQEKLEAVREAMVAGEGLSQPLQRTGLFPGSVIQMVRVGEDTGALDHHLGAAAHFFEQELDYKIKRLTTFFEPAVITVMGLLVGFVAVALISAMYGIFQQSGGVGA